MPDIDPLMESASQKLVEMDYLACERLCLEALRLARTAGDFGSYARILLPLQEARRLRRQTAVDAGVTALGEPKLSPDSILQQHARGCLLLLSPPYRPEDEQATRTLARERGLFVEVLLMGGPSLRACFEQQMERVGDAALAAIPKNITPEEEVDALQKLLDRVGDHEIAHQRLAAAARKAAAK